MDKKSDASFNYTFISFLLKDLGIITLEISVKFIEEPNMNLGVLARTGTNNKSHKGIHDSSDKCTSNTNYQRITLELAYLLCLCLIGVARQHIKAVSRVKTRSVTDNHALVAEGLSMFHHFSMTRYLLFSWSSKRQ